VVRDDLYREEALVGQSRSVPRERRAEASRLLVTLHRETVVEGGGREAVPVVAAAVPVAGRGRRRNRVLAVREDVPARGAGMPVPVLPIDQPRKLPDPRKGKSCENVRETTLIWATHGHRHPVR
jgi:hypothetical protein